MQQAINSKAYSLHLNMLWVEVLSKRDPADQQNVYRTTFTHSLTSLSLRKSKWIQRVVFCDAIHRELVQMAQWWQSRDYSGSAIAAALSWSLFLCLLVSFSCWYLPWFFTVLFLAVCYFGCLPLAFWGFSHLTFFTAGINN